LPLQELLTVENGLVLLLLVLSLGIHEAAHGWVALKCGDPTARDLGRITLNPIPHIDPVMTILLPAIGMISGGFVFGGAKPVPVNYYNLRNPLRDMALVAIAGPASNFLIATFLFFWAYVLVHFGFWDHASLLREDNALNRGIYLNLLLAAFNLLPIPPLDGSRVMTWILPKGIREPYAGLERWGLILVVVAVLFVPPIQTFVHSTILMMLKGIITIVTLGGTW
jgi:Zn-dependent protease